MSELDIIRAWKDKTYRNSLSAEELAQLPEHPAGAIELTNDELAYVDGAAAAYASPAASAAASASAGSPGTTPSIALTIVVSVTAVTVLSALSYYTGTGGSTWCKAKS